MYDMQSLSARSAMATLDGIAANTGQRVMQAARDPFAALAQHRGERWAVMPRKMSTPKPAKRVTKSIRLTTEEADDLAQLVTGTAYAEAALLRQWVLAGMQQFRVVEAIQLYQDGHVDIHQAAARARLPIAIVLDEMAARKVAILDQPDAFGPGLEALRGTFGAGPEEEKHDTVVARRP
jgi:hypothetical protein